ncbi:MAG: hypothetical protein HY749_01795 [Gammaproteobacteria bacterium]|nr:hypothetical protein [Gammaproteobacteria bacterium]
MTQSHERSAVKIRLDGSKPPRFNTLADLLRLTYGSKRKRLALAKSDLRAMQAAPKLEADERHDLLRLASSDRTLERTRDLLLLSAEKFVHHPLAVQVKDFVREVLRNHPAYQSLSLQGVLDNLPEASSIDIALAALTGQPFAHLQWPTGASPLKKREAESLRLAAVHCLLIWLRETRGISLERIQRLLHSSFWKQAAARQKSDGKILRTLILARDGDALGLACLAFEENIREKSRDADAARGAEERARIRAEHLHCELQEASALLEAERSRNIALHKEMEHERRQHEDEKAHLRNDYEVLRGRILRRLRQEVSLLDEGLHALRKQPPKVHVMDDHAERAIDGLKNEIERIKGEVE